MNKIKTTRSILIAVIVAAALGLVACGGGDSGGSPASLLPAGVVATNGDGVNLTEYNAISCGMPKDEVRRIVADAPADERGYLYYSMGEVSATFYFENDLVKSKQINRGKTLIDSVKC
jgi:hypothetical protein